MTPTSQSTDQPTGEIITNEAALERVFRAQYDRLLADAKTRLGPEAAPSAPRIVSKAFHQAWNDRKQFRTREELDAYLTANIQHGAARELSRRAGLHRMESAEGLGGKGHAKHEIQDMTVDEAWDRLHHTLQGGAPEAYKARASAARHEAAEHVAQLGKGRNWTPMIIVGVVGLALILGIMYFVDRAGQDRMITSALAAPDARSYETSFGQQVNITLDDGTVVRLGPESKLTIPKRFGIGLRAIKLDGAANFDVTQALDQPLQVRSGNAILVPTATNFTVQRYPSDPTLILWVKEGTVEARFDEQVRPVSEGTGLQITADGQMSIPSASVLDETRTWVDGHVTISGRSLRSVLPLMKRWYGLDINVADTKLLERQVFLRAAVNSPKEAIASVEQSGGVKFGYVGENMAFQDTTPSRAAGRRR